MTAPPIQFIAMQVFNVLKEGKRYFRDMYQYPP